MSTRRSLTRRSPRRSRIAAATATVVAAAGLTGWIAVTDPASPDPSGAATVTPASRTEPAGGSVTVAPSGDDLGTGVPAPRWGASSGWSTAPAPQTSSHGS